MKKRRIYPTMIASILLCGFLFGCAPGTAPSGTSQSAAPEPAQPSASAAPAAPRDETSVYPLAKGSELDYWFPLGSNVLTFIKGYEENPTMQEAEKRTGVRINWISPMLDHADELLNLIFASDDLPDLMAQSSSFMYANGYDAAIRDGYFLALNPYLDEFAPKYKKVLEVNTAYYKAAVTDEGNVVGFPLFYSLDKNPYCGLGYRRDILQDIGYKETPTTVSEWDRVFTLLLGSGYKNFLTLQEYGADRTFNLWVGAYDLTCTFQQKNGVVSYGPLESGFRNYLSRMNNWYKRGILNRDLSVTSLQYYSSWAAGVTIVGGAGDGSVGPAFYKNGMAEDPDFFLAAAPYPKITDTQTVHFRYRFSYLMQQTCIAQSCSIPEVAVRWCDFWYGDESTVLKNYGVEGVTFQKVGDKFVLTDLVSNSSMRLLDGLDCYTFLNGPGIQLTAPQYDADPYKKAESDVWAQTGDDWCMPADLTMTADENTEFSGIMNDITTLLQESVAGFIRGTKPMNEFDSFIAQIKAMRIDRAIAIQQAALDRYNTK